MSGSSNNSMRSESARAKSLEARIQANYNDKVSAAKAKAEAEAKKNEAEAKRLDSEMLQIEATKRSMLRDANLANEKAKKMMIKANLQRRVLNSTRHTLTEVEISKLETVIEVMYESATEALNNADKMRGKALEVSGEALGNLANSHARRSTTRSRSRSRNSAGTRRK